MNSIKITPFDDVHIKIECSEEWIRQGLSAFFSFHSKDYQFHPKYKSRMWDGKTRLYNLKTKKLYKGLLNYVELYANQNKVHLDIDSPLTTAKQIFDNDTCSKFADILNITAGGNKISPYDYQQNAVIDAINKERGLIVSATGSGKSLIIYMLIRYYLAKLPSDQKVLIIVPTTALVSQMIGDFYDYSENSIWEALDNCHCIYKGASKHDSKRVFISTWQSIYKMPITYYEQFGCVIGDEAHKFKAKNIGGILEKCVNCKHKFGLTGTVGDRNAPINKLQLEGLFGPQYTAITTRQLIDRGFGADLDIRVIKLNYPREECREVSDMDYPKETKYIQTHARRNTMLTNLVGKLADTTLILCEKILHGEELYDRMKKKYPDRPVYIWNGEIDADVRNDDRARIENQTGAIIIASYGTTEAGINIKNLHNVIFASSSKSDYRVMQSIGRGLRISKTKSSVDLYDIVDDFTFDGKKNYSVKHFVERANMYNEAELGYRSINKLI